MEKEKKKKKKIDISRFLPGMPPDEAAFIERCNDNEECRELIQLSMPLLAIGEDTCADVLHAIAVYGNLCQHDYRITVTYYRRKHLTKWDKQFLKLVKRLRGILKLADESKND